MAVTERLILNQEAVQNIGQEIETTFDALWPNGMIPELGQEIPKVVIGDITIAKALYKAVDGTLISERFIQIGNSYTDPDYTAVAVRNGVATLRAPIIPLGAYYENIEAEEAKVEAAKQEKIFAAWSTLEQARITHQ